MFNVSAAKHLLKFMRIGRELKIFLLVLMVHKLPL